MTNALVECARLPFARRPERRFAFRRVDLADRHLVEPKLARRLGQDRLHDDDALHAARRALRPRGGVLVSTVTPRQRIASG